MAIISTTRGNPQASDVAVQTATPMLGGASREDAQTVISAADAEIAKLFEDRNISLVGGGLITFTGTAIQFTEALTLHINSQVAGGAPTVISLAATTRAVSATNRMVYAVINRGAGTATVTDDATTLAAVTAANQEVVLIAKRVDAGDGTQRLYFRNGSTYNAGQTARLGSSGSGSGSGEINVINNPTDATNWVASGAGITVATTTTTSDLPLNGITATAIKITPVSGTDYARYRWQMPVALLSKRLKVEWFQHPLSGYAAGDLKLEVYTNTASDYSGTYVELALAADVSGTSAIPAGDGKYSNAFDSTSVLYYELRIVRVAGTTALNIVNVVVGPGVQASSPVVDAPAPLAVTYDNLGTVTNSDVTYTRTGGRMKVQGAVTTGTIVAGTPAINLPSGFTLNTGSSGLSTNARGIQVGWARIIAASASEIDQVPAAYAVFFDGSTTTKLFISERTQSGALKKHNATDFLANGDSLSFDFDVPVGEFTGSGSTNLGSNDVEYIYNSNTSTSASDTTSFAYGSGGAAIVAVSSAGTTVKKRIRTGKPMGATRGKPKLEVSPNGTNWFQAEAVLAYLESGTERYGMRLVAGGTALTDVDVEFGGDGANGTEAWSVYTTWQWRVTVEQPGVAVGFGNADASSSGFISSGAQTISGAKTWNDVQTWLAAAGTIQAGNYNSTGAWTFGPTNTLNAIAPAHTVNGHLMAGGTVGTVAGDKQLIIGTNIDIAAGSRNTRVSGTTTSGSGVMFHNTTSDTGNTIEIYTNLIADNATGHLAVVVASVTPQGTWTFGKSGAASTHNFNGQLSTTTAGTATNSFISSGGVSQVFVQSGSASFGAYTTYRRGAVSFGEIGTDSTKTGIYFGTYNPSFAYVGSISLAGLWTIGTANTTTSLHNVLGQLTTDTSGATGNDNNFTVNAGATGRPIYKTQQNSVTKGFFATSAGASGHILTNDTAGQTTVAGVSDLLFSGDGATNHGQVATTGNWTIGAPASGGSKTQIIAGQLFVNSTNNPNITGIITGASSAVPSGSIGSGYVRLGGPSGVATFNPNFTLSGMPAGYAVITWQAEGSGAGGTKTVLYKVLPSSIVAIENASLAGSGLTITTGAANTAQVIVSNTNAAVNTIDVAVMFLGIS